MSLAEQTVDDRGGGREDGTVLLIRVRRRDEKPAAQLVARYVCRAETTAENSRAM